MRLRSLTSPGAKVNPASPITSRFSRSEEHTSELQSQSNLVCRLLLEKKKKRNCHIPHYNNHHDYLSKLRAVQVHLPNIESYLQHMLAQPSHHSLLLHQHSTHPEKRII